MTLKSLKAHTRLFGILGFFLFIFIIGFEALPLMPNNTLNTFKLIGMQRSLGSRIVSSALVLAYQPEAEHAAALDIIQKSIGPWEQVQAGLYSGAQTQGLSTALPDDVAQLIAQSEPDFASLDGAAHAVLKSPEHINPLQISILVDHRDAYFITMSQVLNLVQQKITTAATVYFLIELVLESILFIGWLLFTIMSYRVIKNSLEGIKG